METDRASEREGEKEREKAKARKIESEKESERDRESERVRERERARERARGTARWRERERERQRGRRAGGSKQGCVGALCYNHIASHSHRAIEEIRDDSRLNPPTQPTGIEWYRGSAEHSNESLRTHSPRKEGVPSN